MICHSNKKTSIGKMTNNKKYVEVKKLNEVIEKEKIAVENMIYEIKGKQVMLDTDVSVTKCNGNMVNTL